MEARLTPAPCTPLQPADVFRQQKNTPLEDDSDDDVMLDGKESEVDLSEDEDFQPEDTVLELHNGKQNTKLAIFNVERVFNIKVVI